MSEDRQADWESWFGPRGALAQAHPSYEPRAGQQKMAAAVGRALTDGHTAMIEAGTGTGKTLAYLVPALLSGRKVIVSTGTRNLQDQIYNQDLPFLRERLNLRVSATVIKGRENYLCRYRLAEFEREPLLEDLAERKWLPVISEWSHDTETGDRAEIAELPDQLRVWRDVNARADTCTGRRCPEYESCWLTKVKREAQQSQIVVVNHHLFFADLALRTAYGAVLPDYDTVLFDEAHLIEDVATRYFGVQISSRQIDELARDAEAAAAERGGPARGGGGSTALREANYELFLPLRDRLRHVNGRVRFDPASRAGPDLEAQWAVLSEALDEVERQAGGDDAEGDTSESLAQRTDGLRTGLQHVLARDDVAFVYGMERRGRDTIILGAAPIDVSSLLREQLFDRLDACVLTSATLAVDGEFDFFIDRLGLDGAETAVVESSFDYPNQAALFLPRDMPEPSDPMFIERAVERIVELLEITDGRAFLLFTSYSNMQQVHGELVDRDRWPLLLQGEGSKIALVETFKRTPRAVLCGTTSFWHGVDVPGDALSLVVVDKLPFAVPSDPLIAARIDRIRAEKGNPFMEYQTPMAVLELKQGLGRLLRGRADRGLLAVLDPRVTTRRYGKTFIRSLPGYRVLRDVEPCAEFFHEVSDR
ncbi:MAG: ATP-dependent DNA helicase [bacterium]|nr:ATP-dependent DNA helicase [bacterium]